MLSSLALAYAVADEVARVLGGDPYNPGSGKAPPVKVAEKIHTLMDWSAWTVTSVCVVGVFYVAGRMALQHQRGQGGEHAAGLAWVGFACVLVGSASAIVGALT